jgi:hypothetical protein
MPGAAVRRRPPNSPTHHPERPSLPPPRYDLAFFGLCVFFFVISIYTKNTNRKPPKNGGNENENSAPPSHPLIS